MAYADKQMSGAAGEFLTAGKLFKLGYQVGVTYGNAKAIDLLVLSPATGKKWAVQVKAQRSKNCFPAKREQIKKGDIYVFVRLNEPDQAEEFFVVPGSAILDDIDLFFGSSYRGPKASTIPGINYGPLAKFRDNWGAFDA